MAINLAKILNKRKTYHYSLQIFIYKEEFNQTRRYKQHSTNLELYALPKYSLKY